MTITYAVPDIHGRFDTLREALDEGHIYLDGGVENTGRLNVTQFGSRAGETPFL